jgi:nucleotide-binding universal stress UspA family protein
MSGTAEQHRKGRIVVGVDGSEASKDALRWAAAQAEVTGAALEVVMTWVVHTAAYAYGVPMPTAYDFAPQSEQELDGIVQQTRGEFPRIEVSGSVIEGLAGPVLFSVAKDADLLVVGTRGHGAVVGVLLGSVSEYCITHATCPVVVVRHGTGTAVDKSEPVGSSVQRRG